jgi:hypothetical protein
MGVHRIDDTLFYYHLIFYIFNYPSSNQYYHCWNICNYRLILHTSEEKMKNSSILKIY